MQGTDQNRLSFPDMIEHLRKDATLSEPKDGGSVFKGDITDLKEAKKINLVDAQGSFGKDKKTDLNLSDIGVDTRTDPGLIPDDNNFTIDSEKEIKLKEMKKPFNAKAFFGQKIGEKPKPEVKAENTETEFELMVSLRNEIDRYNELIRISNRLEKDIEKRATQKELQKLEVVDTIRSAIFSTEYHTSVGRNKLAHLADTLEDEEARKEVVELSTDIGDIETVKDAIMEKLDILLRKIVDERKVDKLKMRLTSNDSDGLILETEMNNTEPENFKADIVSMCDNRIDEIRRSKNPEKIISQIEEVGAENEANQPKAEIDDEISVGSAGLAKASNKATTEAIKGQSIKVEESVGDNKGENKSTESPVDQTAPISASVPVAENKIQDPATLPIGKAGISDSVPSAENIYQDIATEAAADNVIAETSDISEKVPAPKKKLDFEQMADILPDGTIGNEVTEISEEVDLSNPKGDVKMSAGELADLTEEEKDPKKKYTEDLIEKPIEVPNVSNRKEEIQKRLKELQAKAQETETAESGDFFKTEDKKTDIKDMYDNSLGGGNKATEQIIVPEQAIAKPQIEQTSNKSTPEVQKGPDLTVATPVKPQENQKNDESITEPIKAITKKANLYQIMTGIFKRNNGKDPTANMFSGAEADVLKTREAVVAEEAKLMEKK